MLIQLDLGYFRLEERPDLSTKTFRQIMAELIEEGESSDLGTDLAAHLNVAPNSGVMMVLRWLGLLDAEPVPEKTTLLDVLADQMLEKMPYREGERDMVILVHEFDVAYSDREEAISATLIDFGDPDGDSAMARTVGLPAAVGARMILEGEIDASGVHIPILPEIYRPILDELGRLGISFEESVSK